jgi:osmoprotectant transport system substrate-binding protein
MVTRRTLVKGMAVAPVAGAALLSRVDAVWAQSDKPVTVGSKNFTEQFILGNMYALLLKEAGIPVETSLNLGGTGVAQGALVKGDIDLYPEYTGTGLTEILKIPIDSVKNATPAAGLATPIAAGSPAAGGAGSIDERVYQIVKDEYKKQFNLVWLDQVPFNDTQALAVKRDFSEQQGFTTISQLAEKAGDLTVVAPSDFSEREDGALGLQRVYNLKFGKVLGVDPGIRYQALDQGQADVVLAFGTDGQVSGMDLVLLKDDKGLWPPYHVAPVVRQETLDANPKLADALNQVAPLLTDEVMSKLNYRVDGPDKEEPEDVAKSFLKDQGLIGG